MVEKTELLFQRKSYQCRCVHPTAYGYDETFRKAQSNWNYFSAELHEDRFGLKNCHNYPIRARLEHVLCGYWRSSPPTLRLSSHATYQVIRSSCTSNLYVIKSCQ